MDVNTDIFLPFFLLTFSSSRLGVEARRERGIFGLEIGLFSPVYHIEKKDPPFPIYSNSVVFSFEIFQITRCTESKKEEIR